MIQDILTYSKIGSDEKSNDSVDLNEIVNTVRENLTVLLEDKNGTVTTDTLPVVQGNKTQILQVLQNLTNNGMKYQDGSTVPHVHISATELDEFWEISVKDNGIGIAKNIRVKYSMSSNVSTDVKNMPGRESDYPSVRKSQNVMVAIFE